MRIKALKEAGISLPITVIAVVLLTSTLAVIPAVESRGFIHGIVINVDGEDYYLSGPPDGPDGAKDVPGHYWVMAGPNQLVGKHYDTGPFGDPKWWSSDDRMASYST